MAETSKLDSQFILETNKMHHKGTQDELSFALHRSVRSHTELESFPPQDLRNHLRTLYKSMYEEDQHFETKASKLIHSSIQQMQSHKKHSKQKKQSSLRTITKKNDDDAEFVKPKRRQRRKPKQEERFTPSWNKSILHKKIKVYWPLDKKFYRGIVSAINESKQKPILIKYGDGDKEWLNLKNENFIFYEISSQHNTSDDDDQNEEINKKSKKKSKKKKRKRKRKKKKSPSKSPKPEQNTDIIHEWIDNHVTITIDGDRFDGIVEEKYEDFYKIKFDATNERQSEWVRTDQMEPQQTTTCHNFKIGDNVEVRENNEWLEVIGIVQQIYQGATAIIVQILFPEFDNVFMYYSERDVKKTGSVSD